MANCSKCGRTVGCSCNLRNGVCGTCLGKTSVINQPRIPAAPQVHPQRTRVNPSPNRYNPPVVNRAYWTK